jgi:SepF-like predicted cell division protein (DUF552 family)
MDEYPATLEVARRVYDPTVLMAKLEKVRRDPEAFAELVRSTETV